MVKKLYKKLYLYTIVVLIATMLFTVLAVNLITRRDFQGSFEKHIEHELSPLKLVIRESNYEPDKINNIISVLEKETSWNISFWKSNQCFNNCEQEHLLIQQSDPFKKLLNEKRTQVIHRENFGPVILSYIDSKNINNGFVIVSFNDFPPPPGILHLFLNIAFILFFLMILLIPYTKFVLKPFRELMKSLSYFSSGNFSNLIHVNNKSEFREIAEAFNNMTLKIQDMINEKQQLIAYISHELRTPLTKILIAQELLLKEGKGKEKYIISSIQETENLNNLIDELLESSELELNPEKFNLIKTDFKEILQKNIENNHLLFENNSIKINTDFSDKPVIVKVNQNLIDHALNNIFSNIIKYAPINSQVDLFLKAVNDKALLSVRDYGPGVKEDDCKRIFEPFYKTSSSGLKAKRSAGLGLSIVNKIAKLHGGKVWASSASDNKNGLVLNFELLLCS